MASLPSPSDDTRRHDGPLAVFLIFLRLGLTSFGGPVAHLAYFREELVRRRGWLSEAAYADVVALCQCLPGPASSQTGIALGLARAGYGGALAAWVGFTLPSALAMIVFALGVTHYGMAAAPGVLHGLKLVAVAVVAQAVWGMARTLCVGPVRIAIMLVAAGTVLAWPGPWAQVALMAAAAVAGMALLRPALGGAHEPLRLPVTHRGGVLALALFAALLAGLPLLAQWAADPAVRVFDAFYRAGALVFGGGHVVLPLLDAAVVAPGWVGKEAFLAGYGAAQAMPGPLFSFAAFLGAAMQNPPTGLAGGLLCTLAIFLPGALLVLGALPFWESLRRNQRAQAALGGINAGVVGLLLAALWHPVWTSAVQGPLDIVLVALALVALMRWKLPPWLVVVASGVAGWAVTAVV
ncbi:Putative chromate transporter [Cupriavidus phytorum]|uniref:Chromate transporter n=2 Tax=Cupriavidus TaxID=106589 RepID=A0A975XEX6_9BURK|nr:MULTISPECIES: chromate efflux transporter [Cupriavidus]PZX24618.1 chromate transporter [Cupriavidus alkaliphilus]SOY65875.1 Putative chromate transporter [Cupriavidus taiwanensis]